VTVPPIVKDVGSWLPLPPPHPPTINNSKLAIAARLRDVQDLDLSIRAASSVVRKLEHVMPNSFLAQFFKASSLYHSFAADQFGVLGSNGTENPGKRTVLDDDARSSVPPRPGFAVHFHTMLSLR
jgi:hypothetical protein